MEIKSVYNLGNVIYFLSGDRILHDGEKKNSFRENEIFICKGIVMGIKTETESSDETDITYRLQIRLKNNNEGCWVPENMCSHDLRQFGTIAENYYVSGNFR